MNVAECIKTRRSIRRYKDKPVDHSVIDSIVSLASYSPSWKKTQITRYTAVDDLYLLNETADKLTPEYNSKIRRHLPVLTADTFKNAVAVMNVCPAARNPGSGTVIIGISGGGWDQETAAVCRI